MFHLVEHQQRETSRRLGWRAREIERALEKRDSSALRKELGFVPGIADALIRRTVLERRARFPWPWKSSGVNRMTSTRTATRELNKSIAERAFAMWRWCVPRADNIFYIGQYFALGAMLLYSVLGGNLLKGSGKAASEPSLALNSTNSFTFSFPATNLVVTNYIATNVIITNRFRSSLDVSAIAKGPASTISRAPAIRCASSHGDARPANTYSTIGFRWRGCAHKPALSVALESMASVRAGRQRRVKGRRIHTTNTTRRSRSSLL